MELNDTSCMQTENLIEMPQNNGLSLGEASRYHQFPATCLFRNVMSRWSKMHSVQRQIISPDLKYRSLMTNDVLTML